MLKKVTNNTIYNASTQCLKTQYRIYFSKLLFFKSNFIILKYRWQHEYLIYCGWKKSHFQVVEISIIKISALTTHQCTIKFNGLRNTEIHPSLDQRDEIIKPQICTVCLGQYYKFVIKSSNIANHLNNFHPSSTYDRDICC